VAIVVEIAKVAMGLMRRSNANSATTICVVARTKIPVMGSFLEANMIQEYIPLKK
jgi:hypothetical protein